MAWSCLMFLLVDVLCCWSECFYSWTPIYRSPCFIWHKVRCWGVRSYKIVHDFCNEISRRSSSRCRNRIWWLIGRHIERTLFWKHHQFPHIFTKHMCFSFGVVRIILYIFFMSPIRAILWVRRRRSIPNIWLRALFRPFIQTSFWLTPWYFRLGT